jgi:hypothetical protein
MIKVLSMLAVLALSAGVAQPATAAPARTDDDALGVLQQGKGQGGGQGGGGGQEARGGGRGQGGGGGQARESGGRGQGGGGGQDARGSGRGNSGGGEARPSRGSGSGSGSGGGQSARGSSGGGSGGNSGSARNDDRGRGRGSDDASESRGNSGNASSARESRGSSGNAANASGRGNSGGSADRPAMASGRSRNSLGSNDLRTRLNALPEAQRRLANSSRASERMAVGAIARGHARGLAADAFDVRSDNDRVRILNRRGDVLFDMNDRQADDLGGWRMRRLGDQYARSNAPAFCRSGEGHPVWGRQWCLDRGFGLGSRTGTIWSRGSIGDIIFRNPDYRTRYDRVGLLDVLGAVVLNRLGLHSIGMGYDQPLTGYWVADPSGPYLLRVNSGPYEVAEFYDGDRDNRPEVLYVVQPVW